MTALHLGFSCNNRCVFCAQGDLRQTSADRSHEEIERELAALAGSGVDTLALTGGEPTLRTDLAALIARARALGIRSLILQTNGRRLAYRKYAEELAAAGLDRVEISVQGVRPEVHDYHTQTPGSGAQTLAGVRVALAAGLRVAVTTVVTRSSFRHLAELTGHLAERGVEAIHVAYPTARGSAVVSLERVLPRLAMLRPHLAVAARAARQLPLYWSGLPLCVLEGNEAGALNLHGRATIGVFGDTCAECTLRDLCPGLSEAYAQRFGFTELEPRDRDRSTEIRDRVRQLATLAGSFAGLGRLDG